MPTTIGGHDELRVRASISYRQLDYWCRKGLVPDVPVQHGTGTVRTFTARAERRVLTLAQLTRAGFGLAHAAKMAPVLEREGRVDLGGGLALTTE